MKSEKNYIEGSAAIKQIVLASEDTQLIRLYSDMTEFHNRLHREVLLDETYPRLHEYPRLMIQKDIEDNKPFIIEQIGTLDVTLRE